MILRYFKENVFLLGFTSFFLLTYLPPVIPQKPLFQQWKWGSRRKEDRTSSQTSWLCPSAQQWPEEKGYPEGTWVKTVENSDNKADLGPSPASRRAHREILLEENPWYQKQRGTCTEDRNALLLPILHPRVLPSRGKRHFPSSDTNWLSLKTEARLKAFPRKSSSSVCF